MAVFTAWRFAMAFTVLISILGLSDSQCSIQYENKPIQYGNQALLTCPLMGISQVKWWRNTERCGNFSEYSSANECASPLCHVHDNSSYFYYCCTAATVNDVQSVGDEERGCFKIQVCIDVSISHQGSIVAFFNEAVEIFVGMFSEPHPEQMTRTFLTHNTESEPLPNNISAVATSFSNSARLVWQYIFQVPDLPSQPNEGILRFTATFHHENPLCMDEGVTYEIPVLRRSGPSTQPPILTTPEPHTEGSPRLSDSERNGYVAGLALACGLVIIFGLLSAGLIGYIVKWKWQKRSTDSSNNYGFGYGTSPGTTPTDGRPDYSRGISAASTTSTQPLIRNDYERNHPLTLAMSGALPDCNNNGHAPTTNNDNLNTPTPTAQSRLLPSTPDGVPAPSSSNHTTMMATISEERVEPANLMPVYEHLPDGAPLELEGQQTDSSAVNV